MKGYAFGLLLAVILVLTPGAFSIDCGTAKSHNAFFGNKGPSDQLLFMDHPQKEYKLLRVVEADVVFPLKGDSNYKTITRIELYDQYTNGNGGCGYIVSGGVGQKDVHIHIKSQRNRGLDFLVKVYGH